MRSRIYEINLFPPNVLAAWLVPVVTIYADRSVQLYPETLAENGSQPTRHDAAHVLAVVRQKGYMIERRFI